MADGSHFPAPTPASEGVSVVTFGCRLNACESEAIRSQALAEGLTDAVVFNTCAVTAEAVRQARQAIRKARRERPRARLIATGCAAQIDPGSFSAMPELDLVVGNDGKTEPGALTGKGVRVGDIMTAASTVAHASAGPGRGRAYVAIQTGCDHRCTFCVIPFGRGNARSAPAEAVVAMVRERVAAGAREVVLTGVDLTSWGADLAGSAALGDLVGHILAAAPDLRRLRLSSIDAAEIDPALIACLKSEPRLMPHFHLSLQSGDDLILKRMKRRHNRAQAIDLIASLRRARPEVAIGADFIAGFPTETETAFQHTIELVEEAQLSFLHVFAFSPRLMTPAARMPQLPGDLVRTRAARLREAGAKALVRHLDRKLGTPVQALVERPGQARAEDFTRIAFEGSAEPGSLIGGVVASHDAQVARLRTWRTIP